MDAELINNGLFSGKIYFQHGNGKPHVEQIVKEKIEKFGWELPPHPRYSPDVAPSDFHLFRNEFYASGIYDLTSKKLKKGSLLLGDSFYHNKM